MTQHERDLRTVQAEVEIAHALCHEYNDPILAADVLTRLMRTLEHMIERQKQFDTAEADIREAMAALKTK